MHVLTGVQVVDGDPRCWVEGVYNTQREAYEAQYFATERYEKDYGKDPDEDGVEWEVHPVEGRVEE